MRRVLVGVLALVVLGAGALLLLRGPDGLTADGLRDGVDDLLGSGPPDTPAEVPPPEGLALPPVPSPRPVAEAADAVPLSARRVREALGRLADDRRLGRRVAVAVAGTDGQPVVTRGPRLLAPASLLKVLTAMAALETLGPEHRFTTTVVRRGRTLTLVGGGDPFLAGRPDRSGYPPAADLATLARRTASALPADLRRVRLRYDATLFRGPAVAPAWEPDYVPDNVVTPITALWADQGLDAATGRRSLDPARDAADLFARALRARGVRVAGQPVEGPAPDAAPVAQVTGSELVEVVQEVLETSDNEGAEVLLRHVAVAEGLPASFAGGTRAVVQVLGRLGVRWPAGARMLDGSGLARGNRVPASTLTRALAVALADEELAGVAEGLPVAGFTGSLAGRFDATADPRVAAGLGWVRAKTGTLTGVHGLAGTTRTRDGAVLVFAVLTDRVPVAQTLFARARLDRIAAALAACRCAA